MCCRHSWQYQLCNTSVSACGILAAQIGKAILLDHGTGVVIGETAVIGDRVSMLQGVTLGGTGKAAGDRHPKIQEGVLIGAGATILGNIVVGRGAMVAAGSLVLKDVPAHRFNCHPLHLKVLLVEGSSLHV
jgi:serine acetyltransferase